MLDMKKLNETIIRSLEESKAAYNQNMFIVVGKTGAGKSTLINYLKRYLYAIGEGGVAVPIDSDIKEEAETADSVNAVTTWPAAYRMEEGHTLCDCPGFDDTRGPEMRVAVSVSTESVVRRAANIRGLMVVIDFPTLQASRGDGLLEVAQTIGSLIGGKAFDPNASILFVISKYDPRYVKHAYVMKKIDAFIAQQTQLLAEKNSFLETGKAVIKNIHAKQEDPQIEVKNIELVISILKIMQENSHNIVLCDVFDEGESRKKIIEAMERLQSIPKQAFDFSSADNVRRDFTDHARVELVKTKEDFIKYTNFPPQIKEREEKITQAKKELAKFTVQKEKIDKVKPGQTLEEDDELLKDFKEALQSNKKLLEENSTNKENLERKLEEAKKQIKTLGKELHSLDLADDVKFEELHFEKGRLTRVGSSFAAPIVAVAESDIEGVVSNLFVGTLALAGTIAFSPITIAYGALKRLGHTFEYSGPPFKRVEPKLSHANEFKVIENEPSEGRYKAHYESDRGRTGKASLVFYVEKRNVPDNKAKIEKLRINIEELESQIISLEKDLRNIEVTNRDLEQTISSLKNQAQINIGLHRISLEKLIETTTKRIDELTQEKNSRQAEQNTLTITLKDKQPLFNMLMELSAFIEFDPSNSFPDLVPSFKALYTAYLGTGANDKSNSQQSLSPPPSLKLQTLN